MLRARVPCLCCALSGRVLHSRGCGAARCPLPSVTLVTLTVTLVILFLSSLKCDRYITCVPLHCHEHVTPVTCCRYNFLHPLHLSRVCRHTSVTLVTLSCVRCMCAVTLLCVRYTCQERELARGCRALRGSAALHTGARAHRAPL